VQDKQGANKFDVHLITINNLIISKTIKNLIILFKISHNFWLRVIFLGMGSPIGQVQDYLELSLDTGTCGRAETRSQRIDC